MRRIGTLNCGHAAFPIIMGVNEPQYTPEELEKLRADNAKGITYQGKHYSGYEATQMQRKLERAIRIQKRRILTAEATGDKEMLSVAQTRLQVLRQEYSRFSKAAGLRTENERAQVAGFGRKQAAHLASNRKLQAGGQVKDYAEWDKKRTAKASVEYEVIRGADDVQAIARSSGLTEAEVLTVKNHVFFNEHELYTGRGRFAASYDMAVAWNRLAKGQPKERDILLLRHELLESQIEKEYNLTASEAHALAKKTYNWEKKLYDDLGEEGEPDGLL